MRPVQTPVDIWNNKGEKVGEEWKLGLGFAVLGEFMSHPAGDLRREYFRAGSRLEILS